MSLSPCGTWELRYLNDHQVNSSGYGNGGWRYELVERSSGMIVHTWSGHATSSPWSSDSSGVESVSWDGELLVVTHCPTGGLHSHGEVERLLPSSLVRDAPC